MSALLTAEQLAEIRERDTYVGECDAMNELNACSADRRALLAHIDALQPVVNAASILEHAMASDDEAGDDEMYALFEAVKAYRKQLGEAK